MIVCAAIKIKYIERPPDADIKELVVCGLRHCNCFQVIHAMRVSTIERIQGFINHKGEFLDRKEALAHAMECGQITATHRYYQEDHNIDELYSEDLY